MILYRLYRARLTLRSEARLVLVAGIRTTLITHEAILTKDGFLSIRDKWNLAPCATLRAGSCMHLVLATKLAVLTSAKRGTTEAATTKCRTCVTGEATVFLKIFHGEGII